MSNTIKLKRGSGSDPSASDLVVGEVAVRTDSGKLFTKKDDNSVTEIGGGSGAIDDGSITNAKVASDAAIDVSKLSGVLPLAGGTLTGDLTISSATPIINLTDTNNDSDYQIKNGNGDFNIKDVTNGANRISINSSGTVTIAQHMDVGNGIDVLDGNITLASGHTVDGRDVSADGTKLDGIESNATADQSNSEIKTAYEANSDTNAFTDALLSKLNGIASSATNVTNNNQLTNGAGYITATLTNEQVQDIVGGMVSGNTESGITVTYQDSDGTLDFSVASQTDNNFTDTLLSKLNGIASGATNVTNNNQLTNGAGYSTFSGSYNDLSNKPSLFSGSYNDLSNKPTIPTNNNQLSNGAGYITSADGGNADQVDGLHASSFLRSDTGDTASGDITFSGGAGAATINGGSDIRFNNGSWTGESTKIQHHDNRLYIQGGTDSSKNIVLRSNSGSDRWYMSNAGALYPANDNAYEIGGSSNRVQNLWMAGGIYLGGTGSNNYLDDYEEGDWTPSLLGGSNGAGGYSIRDGSYVKIGRMVHVNFGMAITSKGSMSGDLNVGSLPFTVQHIINDTSIEASGICGYWKHVDPNSSTLTLVAEQDSNIFVRHTVGPEDDPDQMSSSHIDSDFTIRGSITYFTSQ